MNKQKISFLIATFMGVATLVPALANAQVNVDAGANVNVGGMMRGGPEGQGRGGYGQGRGMGQGGMGRGMMPGAMGQVTAISGNTITISSMMRRSSTTPEEANPQTRTLTVDATNAVVVKDGATSTLANISVGDRIFAQGTLTGTNIVATKIMDGMMRPRNPNSTSTPGMMNGDNNNGNGGGNLNHGGGMMNGNQQADVNVDANAHVGIFGGIKNFFSHLFGF